MTEAELLLNLTTKLFGKSEDEIKPLIYEGDNLSDKAFENLLSLDNVRVKRFNEKMTEQFNAGHKKAKGEVAGEIENFLKQNFELDIDGNYETIAEAIKTKFADVKAKGKEITFDDIKKHPEFLKFEKNVIPKDVHVKQLQEFENFKKQVERDKKFSVADKLALQYLDEFKVDYDEFKDTPLRKQKAIENYLKDVKNLDDIETDGDNVTALIKDGKRLEDSNYNPINYKDYTKEKASYYFRFLKQEPKGGGGNGRNNGGNGGNGGTTKWKDKAEFQRDYFAAKGSGASIEDLKKMMKEAEEAKLI